MGKRLTKARNSNFELLRIISMLAIVLSHISGQAFDIGEVPVTGVIFMNYFGSASRIAVNLFLMIGVWFMADSDFKAKRFFKLYGCLWFYSVVITLILLVCGCHISLKDLGSSFFPFFRRRMWFVPQYLALMLISPFLKFYVDRIGRKGLQRTVIAGFVLISVICSIRSFDDRWVAAFTWFAYIYLVIAYYKRYGFRIRIKPWVCLAAGAAIYLALASGRLICSLNDGQFWTMAGKIFKQYTGDYKSVPNFICSMLIFVFFSKLDIGSNRVINTISAHTLDVYMIHQQDAFIPVIWVSVFRTTQWQSSPYFILLYLGTAAAVYAGASVIGFLRSKLLEPLWVNSKPFAWLCAKLDGFYRFAGSRAGRD